MKLYDFPLAPNPRKVRVYLAEKGLAIPLEMVNLVKGGQHAPDFAAKNPMGGVPVLELDDGTVLRESLAIIEYLEELHPEPPMIGTTPLERAQVRAIERTADIGVLLGVGRLLHNTHAVLPGRVPNPEVAAAARRDLEKPARYLDSLLADGRPFLAGPRVTIADCTLFAALEFERGGRLGVAWPEHVARWYERFRARPSAAA
jgi:glutathione S-transferase